MSSSDVKIGPKPGSRPQLLVQFPFRLLLRLSELFRPKFSGETNGSDSGQIAMPPRARENENQPDPEAGRARALPPVANGEPAVKDHMGKKRAGAYEANKRSSDAAANGHRGTNVAAEIVAPMPQQQPTRRLSRNKEVVDVLRQNIDDKGFLARHSHMKYELGDTPGLVPIGLYGFQHYLSMLGFLILVPLVIVPAMGGTYVTVALIQCPSFVYLASALPIINSPEFQGLKGNNIKHIMKELQGAIIIISAFQAILGYSGLMSLFLRYVSFTCLISNKLCCSDSLFF